MTGRDVVVVPTSGLNFTEADKDALEAVLRTFTDDEFLNDPKFSDPFEP